jgi:hypothetical protein
VCLRALLLLLLLLLLLHAFVQANSGAPFHVHK